MKDFIVNLIMFNVFGLIVTVTCYYFSKIFDNDNNIIQTLNIGLFEANDPFSVFSFVSFWIVFGVDIVIATILIVFNIVPFLRLIHNWIYNII